MSKADNAKNARHAALMKEQGVTRKTGLCNICYKLVSIPMDKHIAFHK